jgi:hypothetical protein
VKRSPLDLRPLFGIPHARGAAALAHVVSAYARGGFLPPAEIEPKLRRTAGWLAEQRCAGFEEPCFGYDFDVQTGVFFYPRGAPNTIATAFAGTALLDAYERLEEPELLELAAGTGDFFVRHIPQTEADRGAFFGYLAGDRTPIHNANLLACALLVRLSSHLDRADFRQAAEAGIAYTLSRQRPDGSWPYGDAPQLDWIDNFHTGYVLDSLMACAEAGFALEQPIERGLHYYRSALFLDDGTPRYTPGSVYPVDSQCVAQGIQTFARAGSLDQAYKVFRWAHSRMRRRDGAFFFQRRRLWVNRTPHVRWTVAPIMLALANLLRATEADV